MHFRVLSNGNSAKTLKVSSIVGFALRFSIVTRECALCLNIMPTLEVP